MVQQQQQQQQQQTYYEILNIPSTATQDQIKTAYKSKLLSTHPDKSSSSVVTKPITTNVNTTSSSLPSPDINQILAAYTTLSSPQLRSEYDTSLQTQSKINGFNLTGDGLDSFTLDDFECIELDSNDKNNTGAINESLSDSNADSQTMQFVKSCPRCQCERGMILTEDDLINKGTRASDNGGNEEEDDGRFDIIVQCNSCSLWIHVKYYEEIE
ncbi:DPH4 [Candida margitis]|uniref:DPH4 n=1 Tax=Candida margitis TaxID=1775924 RepID=UPI00222756EF|nr:DPH4 [Candida margitis]KAI5954065.1 DPH4 [Candida margitis]